MPIFTFRDLEAWKKGMDLVVRCYEITAGFPQSERYGLAREIRRAAVSRPSNVAEGHCRRSTPAYANHVSVALGSHGELDTCFEAAYRLKLIPDSLQRAILSEINEEGRILNGLHSSLDARIERERLERSGESGGSGR